MSLSRIMSFGQGKVTYKQAGACFRQRLLYLLFFPHPSLDWGATEKGERFACKAR